MPKIKFIIFAIAFLFSCQTSHAVRHMLSGDFKSYLRQFIEPTSAVLSIATNFQESCEIRQAPGFVCMDCQLLGRCVFRNGHWETILLEACDAAQGLYCNANEQSCSANPGPCHPGTGGGGEALFPCSSSGIFPNPFNCQMYHMCFPAGNTIVAANILCGGMQAFNPVTSDCTLTTSHQICLSSMFTCNHVGQMGEWPLNANIYYICMARSDNNGVRVLFPQLYRCPVGQKFYNEDCVPNGNLPGGPGGFTCTRPGLFPDPNNCRAYFFCDGNLRSQHIMCPTGTYFNQIVYGCVRGNC